VDSFRELAAAFAGVAIHYAVKANPHPRKLAALHAAGCRFEAASWAEVRAAMRAGADPSTVLFTQPIKPADDIARARRAGVWRFAADSNTELHKIARYAPGAAVLLRIDTGAGGTVGDQGKFGIQPAQAPRLARLARSLGLNPYGLAFHVGSQTMDPGARDRPIGQCAQIMAALDTCGIRLAMLDAGGGFPVRYDTDPLRRRDHRGGRLRCTSPVSRSM
jgi:ornithine decarboxylase